MDTEVSGLAHDKFKLFGLFPTAAGQGLGEAGPKYIFGHIPIRVTH